MLIRPKSLNNAFKSITLFQKLQILLSKSAPFLKPKSSILDSVDIVKLPLFSMFTNIPITHIIDLNVQLNHFFWLWTPHHLALTEFSPNGISNLKFIAELNPDICESKKGAQVEGGGSRCSVHELLPLKENTPTATLFNNDPRVKVTYYFFRPYIHPNSQFPLCRWAELACTTNPCESFHSRFNSYFLHGSTKHFCFRWKPFRASHHFLLFFSSNQ